MPNSAERSIADLQIEQLGQKNSTPISSGPLFLFAAYPYFSIALQPSLVQHIFALTNYFDLWSCRVRR